jgi:hypothetical protein
MTNPFQTLLQRSSFTTKEECLNKVHEIIQEIALVGLSRARFFDKAAFYGGTALRIFYGLDRFSEDLDFSLITPNVHFALFPFLKKIEEELESFGLIVKVEEKIKHSSSAIVSAFLKTTSLETLLHIDLPLEEKKKIALREQIKVKIEIDTDPPSHFSTEVKFLLSPLPCAVRTFTLPSLFAGKMHALLFRPWKVRVKGRDWYDFVWFVAQNVPLDLKHLQTRMRQSQDLKSKASLSIEDFKKILIQKIETLSIEMAKKDIFPFLVDKRKIEIWSKEFFLSLVSKISFL